MIRVHTLQLLVNAGKLRFARLFDKTFAMEVWSADVAQRSGLG